MSNVSIPFKREGVFKEWLGWGELVPPVPVSIPFKREGVFKAMITRGLIDTELKMFQFPSSGKGCSKVFALALALALAFVSIPFKREGVFKAQV